MCTDCWCTSGQVTLEEQKKERERMRKSRAVTPRSTSSVEESPKRSLRRQVCSFQSLLPSHLILFFPFVAMYYTVTSFFTSFRPLFPIFLTFCRLPLFACLRSLSSYFLLYFFPSFCLPFKSLLSSSFLQSSFLPSFPSFIPSSTLFLYSFPLCSLPFIPAIPSYPT